MEIKPSINSIVHHHPNHLHHSLPSNHRAARINSISNNNNSSNNNSIVSNTVVGNGCNTNTNNNNNNNHLSKCAGCKKPILERFLLKALDQLWHEDCLKCSCCDCRLGEVGSTLFSKANLTLCKRDYLRLFGATGLCSACNKMIPAFEMVMRVRGNRVYHLECFQCSQCNHRFCIGDRFHLYENRILCEYDFEELLVFGGNAANETIDNNNDNKLSLTTNTGHDIDKLKKPPTESLAAFVSSASSGTTFTNNRISHTTNQQSSHQIAPQHAQDDASSGYGSPDSLLSDGR